MKDDEESAPHIGLIGLAVLLLAVWCLRPVQWWWRLSDAVRRI